MNDFRQAGVVFASVLALYAPVSADTPDGKTLLNLLDTKPKEFTQLESGEVLTKLASKFEQSPRELSIDAAVIIRKPLDQLIEESEDDLTLVPGRMILASGELDDTADFSAVRFEASEAEEAKRWLNAKPGDDLNLGSTDLDTIAALKVRRQGRSDLELASEAVRRILARRYRQYTSGGLSAIEPYARKRNKRVSAGAELRLSNEQLFGVDRYFPDYYDTLVGFPDGEACCQHRFMWMKVRIRKRPAFILLHRIVQEPQDAVLLTERHFYVSHTLNSLQLTLGWLPYQQDGEDTYLGIATSASSDYLTGLVGKMIRTLGANKGAEMVGEVLVDIREDLEAGTDSTAESLQ